MQKSENPTKQKTNQMELQIQTNKVNADDEEKATDETKEDMVEPHDIQQMLQMGESITESMPQIIL